MKRMLAAAFAGAAAVLAIAAVPAAAAIRAKAVDELGNKAKKSCSVRVVAR